MCRLAGLLVLAACGGGDADDGGGGPLETHVLFGIDPAIQGFAVGGIDGKPFSSATVGVDGCGVSGGETYLFVAIPPEPQSGQVFEISAQTSFPDALRAGQAHASIAVASEVVFATGGSVAFQSGTDERLTAIVHATFAGGPFDVQIDAPPCQP
jgi:hypothetical protein